MLIAESSTSNILQVALVVSLLSVFAAIVALIFLYAAIISKLKGNAKRARKLFWLAAFLGLAAASGFLWLAVVQEQIHIT